MTGGGAPLCKCRQHGAAREQLKRLAAAINVVIVAFVVVDIGAIRDRHHQVVKRSTVVDDVVVDRVIGERGAIRPWHAIYFDRCVVLGSLDRVVHYLDAVGSGYVDATPCVVGDDVVVDQGVACLLEEDSRLLWTVVVNVVVADEDLSTAVAVVAPDSGCLVESRFVGFNGPVGGGSALEAAGVPLSIEATVIVVVQLVLRNPEGRGGRGADSSGAVVIDNVADRLGVVLEIAHPQAAEIRPLDIAVLDDRIRTQLDRVRLLQISQSTRMAESNALQVHILDFDEKNPHARADLHHMRIRIGAVGEPYVERRGRRIVEKTARNHCGQPSAYGRGVFEPRVKRAGHADLLKRLAWDRIEVHEHLLAVDGPPCFFPDGTRMECPAGHDIRAFHDRHFVVVRGDRDVVAGGSAAFLCIDLLTVGAATKQHGVAGDGCVHRLLDGKQWRCEGEP